MPFPQQTPRLYTRQDIELLNPGQLGCYGIFRQGTWIYVGKGDIRANMLRHVGGDNPRITREHPTHWVNVVTNDYDDVEKRLILELNPVANRRVG